MLVKTGLHQGVHYPGVGFESKENKGTIVKTQRVGGSGLSGGPPDADAASDLFVDKQRLRGGGAATHGVDAHRMVHRGALPVGAAVC